MKYISLILIFLISCESCPVDALKKENEELKSKIRKANTVILEAREIVKNDSLHRESKN